MKLQRLPAILLGASLVSPVTPAQEGNLAWPAPTIERKLADAAFEVRNARGARFDGDRTQKVLLGFEDGTDALVKWAAAPRGGGEVNNRPRYERAAYEFQKLFLDPEDWVVPPTVFRIVSGDVQSSVAPASPTFRKSDSVLVVLQYWLQNVQAADVFDLERFDRDAAYRRRLAVLNVFTHLVWHNDTNTGNFLISSAGDSKIWAVDNGFAFGTMDESDRGFEWRELRVGRLPADVVDRLRKVDHATLTERLGVLAQYEIRERRLVPVPPGKNLSPLQGIRRSKNVIQLGLNLKEIGDVHRRLRRLLRKVDRGDVELF